MTFVLTGVELKISVGVTSMFSVERASSPSVEFPGFLQDQWGNKQGAAVTTVSWGGSFRGESLLVCVSGRKKRPPPPPHNHIFIKVGKWLSPSNCAFNSTKLSIPLASLNQVLHIWCNRF